MLRPDRVALQDVTGQMALLQFRLAGQDRAQVPTTVHCDHLIRAQIGAAPDLARARLENNEVFTFLRAAAANWGLGFWEPGSGIIHQVVLENYAVPGSMIIGTDSHTPNGGGLGTLSIGVGGADAVDVMVGFPWEVLAPSILGVRLTGSLEGWSAPKDVILKLAGILTTKGGTNRIIEYFGPGCETISCTGKATITNMGAEVGATTSVFPFDRRMSAYLRSTGRSAVAELAEAESDLLVADPEIAADPARFYDEVIEIDLSALEPHVVGPHRPDRARPLSDLADEIASEGFPEELSAVLIGSCTNSSYEDISRAAEVARQATSRGLQVATPLLVTPGSEMVRATLERDGQIADLEAIGATVLANACGPCIGQWRRADPEAPQEPVPARNSIVTSFNRNFPRRNDGNPETMNFITSPEVAVGLAIGGRLGFDPRRDRVPGSDGVQLRPPSPAPEVPDSGFIARGYRLRCPQRQGRPDQRRPRKQPPAAAGAIRSEGAGPVRRHGGAPESGRAVHDRPHLAGRSLAEVPRPSRQHLRQHVPGRQQRFRRPARTRRRPGRRRRPEAAARGGAQPGRGGPQLGGRRRRKLRRGVFARARRDVAASAWGGRGDHALVCAHPRDQPQKTGGPAPDVR